MLLEQPGELVSRAEIQQRLWPGGTFVDFDHGLNTAINRIREALGDSAAGPRYIETLARRGYRFIAPVEEVNGDAPARLPELAGSGEASSPARTEISLASSISRSAAAGSAHAAESQQQERGSPSVAERGRGKARRLLAQADDLPRAPRPVVRALFLLLQAMYLAFYAVSLARLGVVREVVRAMAPHTLWVLILLIITAAVGIPTRLYLITAAAFNAPGLREKFLTIFPVMFPLDELWALAPFLLAPWIGYGAALGATAALLYAPFAQRSLILMGAGASAPATER
ncbi:MAG: winged helix-turn-helix domain-containing protein [Acidobacteriota bacterium]|nr:winged helix-turn-helix domain-containing protein [Acidobacteriota bacterium]